MRLNNYKSPYKYFKTKKREPQKLFRRHYIQDDHEGKDDWQFTLLDQCTTNVELRKRGLYWQPCLKTVFLNGLNELQILVYNKFSRQNIFFALLIQLWFLLFWLTVIIIYILLLIIIIIFTICFTFVKVIIVIIILSIINVIYFILSLFISYCSYYYNFCLRVACDVYVSPFFVFFFCSFLLIIYILYSHCLYMSRIILLLAIIVYIIIAIITTILFCSTLPVIGGEFSNWIRAAWSTPIHWLLWVSRRVSIIFIFISFFFFFCKLFFVDHRWGVDALFHIYQITSFNYDAKVAKNVGLSCRCHMSNSQIVSSV